MDTRCLADREALAETLPGTEERQRVLASLAARHLPTSDLADQLEDVEDREYRRAVQVRGGRNGRAVGKTAVMDGVTVSHPLPEKFGTRLRILRKRAGLSQPSLASRLGCDRSFVTYMESGRREPSIATARRLARILGVSLDTLVGAQ